MLCPSAVLCARTDARVTSRVSVGAGGAHANARSFVSALSKTNCAFERQASNVASSDTNTIAFNARGTVSEQPVACWERRYCGRSLAAALRSPFIFRSRLIRRPVGGA